MQGNVLAMAETSVSGLNGPTIDQLIAFFQNDDLLADFLFSLGGWKVMVPKYKPHPDKLAASGKFSIYRHAPEYVAEQFREYWPGYRCPIPTARAFLISYLIDRGKTNWEIVRTLHVARSTVLYHRQQYRQQRAESLPR